jgi:SAM-dependent methyltransferase
MDMAIQSVEIKREAAQAASACMPASGIPICRACGATLTTKVGEKNGYKLLRCGDCRSVMALPLPSEEELADYYDNYHGTEHYAGKREKKMARARRYLRRLGRLTPGRRFLDVGCNLGFTVAAARELGMQAHGIDVDARTVARAREMFGRDAFDTVTVEEFARWGKSFDIVFASEVIEHVREPRSFAEALRKLTAPGGVVFVTTPDAGHLRVPRKFESWTAVKPPQHLAYFSREGLKRLFDRAGMGGFEFWMNFKAGIRMTAHPLV